MGIDSVNDDDDLITGIQVADCRHCERLITRILPGIYWLDKHGFTSCVKAVSIYVSPVLHEPVPNGMRGAVT